MPKIIHPPPLGAGGWLKMIAEIFKKLATRIANIFSVLSQMYKSVQVLKQNQLSGCLSVALAVYFSRQNLTQKLEICHNSSN